MNEASFDVTFQLNKQMIYLGKASVKLIALS